jgi:hypothetical protein
MILKEPARTELEAVGSDVEAGQEAAPDGRTPALVGEPVGGGPVDGDDTDGTTP